MASNPIFVIGREGGDVVAFPDVRSAEGFMEPPEVEANAYRVFDSVGHLATLEVRRFDVVIRSWSVELLEDDLRRALAGFLREHGRATDGMDLGTLVADAYKVARDEELARTRPRLLVPLLRFLRRRTDSAVEDLH
jgi:hypothetical protein